ncbi:MAG: DUF4339 domain-containing protein [Bdellovibrionales bacterium]|nr:DUF4339 domain-containing protein [Bdellovibrionales bacterium]
MQKFFYLSKNRETLGPFSIERIKSMLASGQLQATDYVFLEEIQDWVSLLEFLPEKAPTKISKIKDTEVVIDENDWFVLRDQKRFGPYSFLEVIKMLQDQSVKEYDYVWKATMSEWQKVADVEDFSSSAIKMVSLKEDAPRIRRRYPRISLGSSLLIHNDQKVWKGESLEIGEGGCKILISSSSLQVGQSITILFKPNHLLPPFHAKCEVVSKEEKENITHYGVKFLHVEKQVKKAIKQIVKKAA